MLSTKIILIELDWLSTAGKEGKRTLEKGRGQLTLKRFVICFPEELWTATIDGWREEETWRPEAKSQIQRVSLFPLSPLFLTSQFPILISSPISFLLSHLFSPFCLSLAPMTTTRKMMLMTMMAFDRNKRPSVPRVEAHSLMGFRYGIRIRIGNEKRYNLLLLMLFLLFISGYFGWH